MSTKSSIKWRENEDGTGFHLYDDVLDSLFGDDGAAAEPPVYLRLDGIEICELRAWEDGATVTVAMPREMARALNLLPALHAKPDNAPAPDVTSHFPAGSSEK